MKLLCRICSSDCVHSLTDPIVPYLHVHRRVKFKFKWKDVTLTEIMTWHGLIVAMAIQKIPTSYRKYWEVDNDEAWSSDAVRPPQFGRFMSCNR